MSTQAVLGSIIQFEDTPHLVVRIVESSSLFEDERGCYILEEKYAELRSEYGQVAFKMFSSTAHEFKKPKDVKQKGLDPKVWKRF